MLKIAVLTLAAVTLTACADPKIDASTDEEMKKSVLGVRGSLPEAKRVAFDNALAALAFADLSFPDILAQGAHPNTDIVASRMKQRLDGKTGEQVIAEAAQLRADRERKEREQALAEIAELQEKAAAAAAAKVKLAAFVVSRSRFYTRESGFIREPVVELSVTNGTPFAISRAYLHGTVASQGRSVPWISEDFNYQIRGGLEPGESAMWKLAPNSFGPWGTETPKDAILTVEVIKLDGPDNETLYDADGLDDSEQERLETLQRSFQQDEHSRIWLMIQFGATEETPPCLPAAHLRQGVAVEGLGAVEVRLGDGELRRAS